MMLYIKDFYINLYKDKSKIKAKSINSGLNSLVYFSLLRNHHGFAVQVTQEALDIVVHVWQVHLGQVAVPGLIGDHDDPQHRQHLMQMPEVDFLNTEKRVLQIPEIQHAIFRLQASRNRR